MISKSSVKLRLSVRDGLRTCETMCAYQKKVDGLNGILSDNELVPQLDAGSFWSIVAMGLLDLKQAIGALQRVPALVFENISTQTSI